jgi:hypothetical protein
MSERTDFEARVAFFVERQSLLFQVIEGAKYDLGEHVNGLREVIADLKTGRLGDALELLEHELSSVDALLTALSTDGEA